MILFCFSKKKKKKKLNLVQVFLQSAFILKVLLFKAQTSCSNYSMFLFFSNVQLFKPLCDCQYSCISIHTSYFLVFSTNIIRVQILLFPMVAIELLKKKKKTLCLCFNYFLPQKKLQNKLGHTYTFVFI